MRARITQAAAPQVVPQQLARELGVPDSEPALVLLAVWWTRTHDKKRPA